MRRLISPSSVGCADSRAGNVARCPRVGIFPRWGKNSAGEAREERGVEEDRHGTVWAE